MSRLIFIIVIIALVYWLITSYRRKSNKPEAPSSSAQDMVSCARCGVHLPKSESQFVDGKYYCSVAHSREPSDSQAKK